MRRLGLLVAAAAVLGAGPARAQGWELGGTAGFTPAVDLERQADQLDAVTAGGGFTWGMQAARFFTSSLGAEITWAEQASSIDIATPAGEAELYSMVVSQLHANLVYQFGASGSKIQPFIFGGAGGTFFRADDMPSDTKFSWGFGGGVKAYLWDSVGLRGQFGFKPTLLSDEDSGDFCLPFGFCQGSLSQLEFAGGVVIRF